MVTLSSVGGSVRRRRCTGFHSSILDDATNEEQLILNVVRTEVDEQGAHLAELTFRFPYR